MTTQTLITGASGFLGRHLIPALQANGHIVTALTSKHADLTQAASLHPWNATRFDYIYHLAAWTRAGDFCRTHGGEQWIVNQYLNTNVLAWWRTYQPQAKLIAFGTSVSYSSEDNLHESAYMLGEPKRDYYAYAMSKRMLYAGLQALHQQFGLRYLYVVPSTLYGPRYHIDGRQLHFIYDVMRKIVRGHQQGEPVKLWGDGYQRRELVYVADFVRWLTHLAAVHDNDIINLGAGEEHTIRHFAQLICDLVGYPFEHVQFDPGAFVGAKSKCLRIDKLRQLLPDLQTTPLRAGLAHTLDWMLADGSLLI